MHNKEGKIVRELFTTEQARARGLTMAALKWHEQRGAFCRVERSIYAVGPDNPSPLDRARAALLKTGGVACGGLAGLLLGLDSVTLKALRGPTIIVPPSANGRRAGVRRHLIPDDRVIEVHGHRCTNGIQTLIDLAAVLDDARWEQALESALRKKLLVVSSLEAELPRLAHSRTPGVSRIRRVLALRPPDAPPTESLLETLMVQLARTVPGLPELVRQYEVIDENGIFIARLDLSAPDIGFFVELDGEHHKDQPVYDARRETAVVAATGWLCARFTWTDLTRLPRSTARSLDAVARQARRRQAAATRSYAVG